MIAHRSAELTSFHHTNLVTSYGVPALYALPVCFSAAVPSTKYFLLLQIRSFS